MVNDYTESPPAPSLGSRRESKPFPNLAPQNWGGGVFRGLSIVCALLAALLLGTPSPARAVGSWTPLKNQAPSASGGIGTILLLTDGTVLAQGADNGGTSKQWFKLTPDSSGSYVNGYVNGTWTPLTSMHHARQYYASVVLRNGQVFLAGGEYDENSTPGNPSDNNTAEIYDPLGNVWTLISQPYYANGTTWPQIGDAPVACLADGRLLLGDITSGNTALYDYTNGAAPWAVGGSKVNDRSSDEESWALLPDGSVLTVDNTGTIDDSERYLPSSNSWLTEGKTPSGHNLVEVSSNEIGPAVLLPNGNVLYVGATGHTALYSTSSNSWLAGPDFPTVLDVDASDTNYNTNVTAQAKDAPGCLLVNGKVLCLVGATGSTSQTYSNNHSGYTNNGYPAGMDFFEYDPNGGGNGTLTAAPSPGGSTLLIAPFRSRLLALPNGQALMSDYTNQLYVYTPDSGPNPAWAPTVSTVTVNADTSYQVSGTQFNGLSQASAYGDDVSDATNYPLVRLTSGSTILYGRTFNHSTMGVATGNTPVSTNFTLPANLPPGAYDLSVIANGIASTPYTFYTGIYVDAANTGSQNGSQAFPYQTVTQGVNAAPGSGYPSTASDIFIKGGTYNETLTISKSVTLLNNGGGAVTIGLH